MTIRFVLDESSWVSATEVDAEVRTHAVLQLLERLDVARERDEGVAKHSEYYDTDLGHGVRLHSALSERGCPVQFDHDVALRLMLALQMATDFDDADIDDFDAYIGGSVRLAPGMVWAHARCSHGHQTAVLPLPLGEVPHGRVSATVAGNSVDVAFVVEESQHVQFFRSLITIERADVEKFEGVAPSAFPMLEWADGVWHGLGDFSRPYIEVRDELVRHLGGLNDHGAACFHEHQSGNPSQLSPVLSARVGAETSDENGATKSHAPSRRDRTRSHRGINKVFWWHVKIQPHVDRIYFLYEPPPTGADQLDRGRIVVGIFKDHCKLPN